MTLNIPGMRQQKDKTDTVLSLSPTRSYIEAFAGSGGQCWALYPVGSWEKSLGFQKCSIQPVFLLTNFILHVTQTYC